MRAQLLSRSAAQPLSRSALWLLVLSGLVLRAECFESGAVWHWRTLAGNGVEGHADGVGTEAQFGFITAEANPYLAGIVFTPDRGSVVLTDQYNQDIRMINVFTGEVQTLYSQSETIQPILSQRYSLAASLSGLEVLGPTLYFSNKRRSDTAINSQPKLQKIPLSGGIPETVSSLESIPTPVGWFNPVGISAIDDSKLIFTSSSGGIARIDLLNSNQVTVLAGAATVAQNVAKGYTDGTGTNVKFSSSFGIDMSPGGQEAYFVDPYLANLRKLTLDTGRVETVAGPTSYTNGQYSIGYSDGVGSAVRFQRPVDVEVLPDGRNVLITDQQAHTVRRLDLSSLEVSLWSGRPNTAGYSDGGIGTKAAFRHPSGIAASEKGDLIVLVDQGNQRVRIAQKSCVSYYVLVNGYCRACERLSCPLGNFRKACVETQTDGECFPCPNSLPANAEWVKNSQDCEWTCSEGYVLGASLTECEKLPDTSGKTAGLSDVAWIGITCGIGTFIVGATAVGLYLIRDREMPWHKRPEPEKDFDYEDEEDEEEEEEPDDPDDKSAKKKKSPPKDMSKRSAAGSQQGEADSTTAPIVEAEHVFLEPAPSQPAEAEDVIAAQGFDAAGVGRFGRSRS